MIDSRRCRDVQASPVPAHQHDRKHLRLLFVVIAAVVGGGVFYYPSYYSFFHCCSATISIFSTTDLYSYRK